MACAILTWALQSALKLPCEKGFRLKRSVAESRVIRVQAAFSGQVLQYV